MSDEEFLREAAELEGLERIFAARNEYINAHVCKLLSLVVKKFGSISVPVPKPARRQRKGAPKERKQHRIRLVESDQLCKCGCGQKANTKSGYRMNHWHKNVQQAQKPLTATP